MHPRCTGKIAGRDDAPAVKHRPTVHAPLAGPVRDLLSARGAIPHRYASRNTLHKFAIIFPQNIFPPRN